MSLANFTRESILRPRLQRASCMVVYDPERIYRDVVHSLAEEQTVVVDAGEKGIEGREETELAVLAVLRVRSLEKRGNL